MKPAAFRYSAPGTVAEAVALLSAGDAKVLAGGQSLIPILNMRLASPAHLVDINGVPELDYIQVEAGGVRVGAIARHAAVERCRPAYEVVPLLRRALRLVAHPVIRNRGTTVGSIAHADPAGEMTAVLALLGGTVRLVSTTEKRTLAAADFFVGPLESAARPDELVESVHFPAPPAGTGTGFAELSRRHGDYALCGVAAAVLRDPDGSLLSARAAYLSVSATPLVLDLTDAAGSGGDWAAAGRYARDRVDPEPDIHATEAYRRQLAQTLTVRALRDAAADAAPLAVAS